MLIDSQLVLARNLSPGRTQTPRLESLGIEGDFSHDRFTGKVRNHALAKPRQAEEKRLEELAVTSERCVRLVLREQR